MSRVSSIRHAAGLFALLLATSSAPLLASEPVTDDAIASLRPTPSSFESRKQSLVTARTLEQEAARAKEPARAAALLEQAYAIRLFIGPKKDALKDIRELERRYATGDRARAGDAFWRRRKLIQAHVGSKVQSAALRQHAVRYLARYGEAGGIDRAIVAKFVIAEYDWLGSCPQRGLFGLCVTWQREDKGSTGEAVRERFIEQISGRVDAALRAKLSEQLTPSVRERLEKQRTARSSSPVRMHAFESLPPVEARQVYIAPGALARAVEQEVERALPQARAQVFARAGVRAKAKRPRRCNELDGFPAERVVVHRRNQARVKVARKRFQELRRLSRRMRPSYLRDLPRARRFEVSEALGKLELYFVDSEFEKLLGERVPTGLQFHYDEWKKDSGKPKWEREYRAQVVAREASRKRLYMYFERMAKKGSDLQQGYERIRINNKRHPELMLLAASRTAMFLLSWTVKFRTAMIASEHKKLEHARVYCDTLTDMVQPVEKQALDVLTYCVDRATTYQYFTPAARWCEQRLTALDPFKFPELREFAGPSAD